MLRRTFSVGSMDSAEVEASPAAAGTELNVGGLELHSDLSPIRAWWLWCAFGNCLQLSNAAFMIVNGPHALLPMRQRLPSQRLASADGASRCRMSGGDGAWV